MKFWGRLGLFLFFILFAVFGVVVEMRSAFMPYRQTDLGVYLRAAWAARVGEDPYTVKDDNGWHFCYPPVVAMLLTPLADAPQGADRTLMVPWPVSVFLWYLLSIACLFLAVHWIAKALEAHSSDPAVQTMPWGCRRWWFNRIIPIFLCLVQIGGTLARGQVNLMVILFVAGAFATLMKGQRLRSGLWLSAAICLKVIPAFLLLFPLWRRDGRSLVGVALGLTLGLFVLPSLYWGIPEAMKLNGEMVEAVLNPGLRRGGDQTRAKELTDITATDNQSFQATLHNYQYWGRLNTRPGQPQAWTTTTHWLISGTLTLATLLAAGWRRDDDPIRCLLFLGTLFLIMTLVTPVSHLHYFSKALPLVMGLMAASTRNRPEKMAARPAMLFVFMFTMVGYALPSIPIWEGRREAGVPMIVSLVLIGLALGYMCSQRRRLKKIAYAWEGKKWNQAA